MEQTLKIIDKVEQLQEALEYLKDKDFVAYDTETTGLKRSDSTIGISFCAEPTLGWYIILKAWNNNRLESVIPYEAILPLLEVLKTKDLITHHGIFDCIRTEIDFKVRLVGSIHTDTLALAHLLDENRSNKLKDLAVSLFGLFSTHEQTELNKNIKERGGKVTKKEYELYKADSALIARYGAKDAILTFNVFNVLIEELFVQKLDTFFYEETMPLLRGPTYDLNFTGLKIDSNAINKLRSELQANMLELYAIIMADIKPFVDEKYPNDTFNIGSPQQLSWLLFDKLGQEFGVLTDTGRDICKALEMKLPYSGLAKRQMIDYFKTHKGDVYEPESYNPKTKKTVRAKKIGDWFKYTKCDKESLQLYAKKYRWIQKFLEYKKEEKILNTYVEGIREKALYNIIYPSFNQTGTTSGRYSCSSPNFQNLPRDDKRVKKCIISRPGMVFVGADEDQLEPRAFASISKDVKLIEAFGSQNDFYSTIGIEVFQRYDALPLKEGHEQAFGVKYKNERNIAKVVALSATYGTTAPKMSKAIGKSIEDAQEVINTYFERFPDVKKFMLSCHEEVKKTGIVYTLFGRPRRIPAAMSIPQIYGKQEHNKLPYEARTLLNLSVNHKVQGIGASIMNRSAIACYKQIKEQAKLDSSWDNVRIVSQIHDQLILEGPEQLAQQMSDILQDCMENTVKLPGVKLIAKPVISTNFADQK